MRPSAVQAIVGGFFATLVVAAIMTWFAPLLGVQADSANPLANFFGFGWGAGIIVHSVNGTIVLPLIYAFVVYAHMPGTQSVKGLEWGVMLWLIQQTIVMPLTGAGFFSTRVGAVAGASLFVHLIYGAIVGFIAAEVRVLRQI